MDATDPIWRTSAVQEAAGAGLPGALIRMARLARRLSLVQAGKLVGYSASTLSRIETGQRKLTDVTQLRRFAEVFGIPPHLFGLTSDVVIPVAGASFPLPAPAPATVNRTLQEDGDDPVRRREMLIGLVGVTSAALAGAATSSPGANALMLTRDSLSRSANQQRPVAHPATLQVLRRQLAAAQQTFQECRYEELAGMLPEVIGAIQADLSEATGQQRDQSAALLAAAYSLASHLCNRLHDDALAWVTAERARTAAQLSGDPASMAEAARMASIAMRRHGHHDTAIALLTSTALDLSTDSGRPAAELTPTYGSLLCTAAYTAAQHGRRRQALDLITEAERAVGRLAGERPHPTFGSVHVSIYQIGVHTSLGDAGTALDHARKIDLRSVPSPERQARFCVDTARAWQRFGRPDRAFHALRAAGRCAPEELHRSPVRTLIVALLDSPGREPAGLREFAARCGAIT